MMMQSRYHSHFHDVKGVNDVVRILKSSRLALFSSLSHTCMTWVLAAQNEGFRNAGNIKKANKRETFREKNARRKNFLSSRKEIETEKGLQRRDGLIRTNISWHICASCSTFRSGWDPLLGPFFNLWATATVSEAVCDVLRTNKNLLLAVRPEITGFWNGLFKGSLRTSEDKFPLSFAGHRWLGSLKLSTSLSLKESSENKQHCPTPSFQIEYLSCLLASFRKLLLVFEIAIILHPQKFDVKSKFPLG